MWLLFLYSIFGYATYECVGRESVASVIAQWVLILLFPYTIIGISMYAYYTFHVSLFMVDTLRRCYVVLLICFPVTVQWGEQGGHIG